MKGDELLDEEHRRLRREDMVVTLDDARRKAVIDMALHSDQPRTGKEGVFYWGGTVHRVEWDELNRMFGLILKSDSEDLTEAIERSDHEEIEAVKRRIFELLQASMAYMLSTMKNAQRILNSLPTA